MVRFYFEESFEGEARGEARGAEFENEVKALAVGGANEEVVRDGLGGSAERRRRGGTEIGIEADVPCG